MLYWSRGGSKKYTVAVALEALKSRALEAQNGAVDGFF
jgi:hypothetical protein